jgi:hypothetical protein
MKKAFVMLCVFMVSIALPLFADDALVLPKGVLRTYITAAYGYGDTYYDADGKKQDTDEIKAINLGMAIEFGATDWISPGIQWAPGYNVWSEYGTGDANVNGAYDLKVGAKFQIIGPNAPVQSSNMRFAVVPGVKIPLPGADLEKELANLYAGKEGTIADPDKHAWAIGSQASFDYIVNEKFFVNLFCEYMKYLEMTDVEYIYVSGGIPYLATSDINYGYSLKLEVEPHFETPLGSGKLSATLPVTYEMWPETTYSGTGADNAGYSLKIAPSASYFFLAGALPLELKLGYTLPVAGENWATPTDQIVFQFKSYLKF